MCHFRCQEVQQVHFTFFRLQRFSCLPLLSSEGEVGFETESPVRFEFGELCRLSLVLVLDRLQSVVIFHDEPLTLTGSLQWEMKRDLQSFIFSGPTDCVGF
jgi:hypothetical protein